MTNREKLEAKLSYMTDEELQAAVNDYTRRAQEHTENDRPHMAHHAASKAILAQTIQERRKNLGTARDLIAEKEQTASAKHGYGCACHDCGMEREDRKAAEVKQPASILDQWEPAPEWAKAAKRADLLTHLAANS